MKKKLKVVFRVDASTVIGTGHVMRCLTLANKLVQKNKKVDCFFICREHPGNLMELIRGCGFTVYPLKLRSTFGNNAEVTSVCEYDSWLGASSEQDSIETAVIIDNMQADWVVVDHYAVGFDWENRIKPTISKLMVIDDLANRQHNCDILLDQNINRERKDYESLVPRDCIILAGTEYTLLRPEFGIWRRKSVERRDKHPTKINKMVVSMGGTDSDNATALVLEAIKFSELGEVCFINIIMGMNAPWLKEIRRAAETLSKQTQVLVNVNDMARLLSESDIVIGAAGSSSWERCCLGVPTIMVVQAENQIRSALTLKKLNAVKLIENVEDIPLLLPDLLRDVSDPLLLADMSQAARRLVDGGGSDRVYKVLAREL